ncbi:hypothetical protein GCM10007897_28570 [Sphingobium jiangsuense]|uniref:Uncharacterized protein n=1 Tax=Sphingobium jiangsuense TaxID=870476 RepID=A0A7W6BD28_9SPHN|nr:hypothetical protein [Sphingobium jiangsuense]MBB3924665.1 hypothetical protein [Sphingobium jiangsuense]GLT01463.1 hypothetical protein GCM10007897_28570 [Sphingobium jiangsuense]
MAMIAMPPVLPIHLPKIAIIHLSSVTLPTERWTIGLNRPPLRKSLFPAFREPSAVPADFGMLQPSYSRARMKQQ